MLTHIVPNIFRTERPTNFKLAVPMEDDDPHQPQAPWPPRSKVKVAGSRDPSEPSWPNAVPVSLAAGGAYRVGRTRRPCTLLVVWLLPCAGRGRTTLGWKTSIVNGRLAPARSVASCSSSTKSRNNITRSKCSTSTRLIRRPACCNYLRQGCGCSISFLEACMGMEVPIWEWDSHGIPTRMGIGFEYGWEWEWKQQHGSENG